MTLWDLSLPLGLGLATSIHCAQMCGPLVLSYSVASRPGPAPHLFYNLGRILTYAALGAIAGAAGTVISAVSGVAQTVVVVAGALLIIAGILTAGIIPNRQLVRIGGGGVSRAFTSRIAPLLHSPQARSKLYLGLLLGLLPCGMVYAALFQAMATGNALGGAASMVAFGVGTAASLLPIGLFSSFFAARLGRWSTPIAAGAMVLMGCLMVWRGLHAVTNAAACHHY
jgi:sulfite exporter TauE/SafE